MYGRFMENNQWHYAEMRSNNSLSNKRAIETRSWYFPKASLYKTDNHKYLPVPDKCNWFSLYYCFQKVRKDHKLRSDASCHCFWFASTANEWPVKLFICFDKQAFVKVFLFQWAVKVGAILYFTLKYHHHLQRNKGPTFHISYIKLIIIFFFSVL